MKTENVVVRRSIKVFYDLNVYAGNSYETEKSMLGLLFLKRKKRLELFSFHVLDTTSKEVGAYQGLNWLSL